MSVQALRAAEASLSKKPSPPKYNRALRRELRDPSHREEARAEFDLALDRGDADLALWARAWGDAIRTDLRDRFGNDAY